MAYTVNGTNQYLSTSSSPASATPMTIACWVTSSVAGGSPVSVGVSSGNNRNAIATTNISSGNIAFSVIAVGPSGNATATSPTVSGGSGAWVHVAAVYASSTSRTAYANGSAGTENTVNIGTQATANSIVMGARWNNTLGAYLNGSLADVGVWNVALTAAEIASLAKGVSCRLIRPQSLVFYAPLVRDLVDVAGGRTITNNNTATVADHPRIYT